MSRVLLASGVLEGVWATAPRPLRRPPPVPTAIFAVTAVLSLVGLGFALNTLPTGTAYVVWTATGASLTVAGHAHPSRSRWSIAKVLLVGIDLGVVG